MGANDGTGSILKEIIDGAVESPETYYSLFEMALEEYDKTLIVEKLKEKYNEIGKPDLLDTLENLAFYDQFTESARFKKWIETGKKFIIALDIAPEKKKEYFDYWKKYTEKESDSLLLYTVLDRLAFANLVIFITDYLKVVV